MTQLPTTGGTQGGGADAVGQVGDVGRSLERLVPSMERDELSLSTGWAAALTEGRFETTLGISARLTLWRRALFAFRLSAGAARCYGNRGACHGAVVPGCLDDDEGQALGSSPAAGCIKTRNRACVSEVDVTGKDT